MSNTGRRLRENSEEIAKYINQLRDQRTDLGFLVEKQKTEKANLEADMARITYKLSLINKSLGQRVRSLKLYDTTLMEVEAKYKGLADCTQGLLTHVKKESSDLESSIDKRIGTESDCQDCGRCHLKSPSRLKSQSVNEIPTKQASDSDKKSFRMELKRPVGAEGEAQRQLSDQRIYSRAMEYPMMLSPMINQQQIDQMREKFASNSQQALKAATNVADARPPEETFVNPGMTDDIQPFKEPEKPLPRSTHASDTDFAKKPSQDSPEENIEQEDLSKPSVDSTFLEDLQTALAEEENREKPTIDDYDEVIEDIDSRKREKSSVSKIGNKQQVSVDVFRQGYRSQHEKNEEPPSLARYKKSVFNKRNQSMFTKEEE